MLAPETCPQCGDTGWRPADREGVSGVTPCECAKRLRMDRLLEAARIPERHRMCDFESFHVNLPFSTKHIRDAKLIAEKFVDEYPTSPPMGLLFVGKPGVGKTHLAVSIIKSLIRDKAVPCLFRAFPELLKEIQMSFNRVSNTSEMALLSPVLDAEVLVLDELGAQKPTAWALDTVGNVIGSRYNANKTTILTTNYPDRAETTAPVKGVGDSLIDRIGDRIRSRLYEMCKTVPMKGDDFRWRISNKDDAFSVQDENTRYHA